MSRYSEVLKDPRWQRRRLEIFEKANWRCEICSRREITLTVHHVIYIKGRQPWEYADDLLQCLCVPCHKDRQEIIRKITDAFQIAFRPIPTARLVDVAQRIFNEAMEVL